MTNNEALAQLFGSVPAAKKVIDQRRAIAEEAKTMVQRLQSRLTAQFPAVDEIGGNLDSMFRSLAARLEYQIAQIDQIFKDVDSHAASGPSRSRRSKKR
ncbi:MAG: hypothetical protein ABI634_18985 [Acidobacteriota bacterium]